MPHFINAVPDNWLPDSAFLAVFNKAASQSEPNNYILGPQAWLQAGDYPFGAHYFTPNFFSSGAISRHGIMERILSA